MRKFLTSLALIGLLSLFLVIPTLAQRSPFSGAWIGSDPAAPAGDGSTLTLNISGNSSGAVRVSYTDFEATVACPDGSGGGYRASFNTTGTIVGNSLVLDAFQVYCFSPRRILGSTFPAGSIVYIYDPVTDTLDDATGIGGTFTRRGR